MDLLYEIELNGLAANHLADLNTAVRERSKDVLQTYADVLYAHILDSVCPQKDHIMTQLVDHMRTGRKDGVLLWSYSNTYHSHLSRERMSQLSELGDHTVVFNNGRPMCVDRIVQNTDLLLRLACTFGSKFRVKRVRGNLKRISSDQETYEFELRLQYIGEGLTETQSKRLLKAYNDMVSRPLRVGRNVRVTPRY